MELNIYGSYFLKNHQDFENTQNIIEQIIEKKNELPNLVFKSTYSGFLFENFDNTLSSSLWPVLKKLAINSNDSSIILAVLKPDPQTYYFREFGYFNWCNIPVNLSLNEYEEILNFEPIESPFDTIQLNSNLIIWTSVSKKWAIWCDRSLEVSIIAFDSKESYYNLKPFVQDWVPVDDPAVKDWMQFTFEKFKVPDYFFEKLLKNYLNK